MLVPQGTPASHLAEGVCSKPAQPVLGGQLPSHYCLFCPSLGVDLIPAQSTVRL